MYVEEGLERFAGAFPTLRLGTDSDALCRTDFLLFLPRRRLKPAFA